MLSRRIRRRLRRKSYFLFFRPMILAKMPSPKKSPYFYLFILSFLGLVFFIFHFYPRNFGNEAIFFALLFSTVFLFLKAALFGFINSLFFSLFFLLAAVLRYLGIATPVNMFLLAGTLVAIWFWQKNKI